MENNKYRHPRAVADVLARCVFVLLLPFAWSCRQQAGSVKGTYLDASLDASTRAGLLLSLMTLEEKIGQMTQPARDFLGSDSNIALYGFGSVLSGGGSAPANNTAEAWADMVDAYQTQALATRLRIPLLYGTDAVHGHNNLAGAVIFPHNIGLGASFNPQLVTAVARATAVETAATGIRWTFAPCLAVPQDERWGRTYEGFSEDTDLVATLGAVAIRGLQGGNDGSDLAKPSFILATAKHYLGDGGTLRGIDQGDAVYSEADLRGLFLPPYAEAIEAGVGSVMISFSSWNGVKLHQHAYLINEVLKKELAFDGFVVSDWAGLKQLPGNHAQQIRQAVNAGIDMVMVPDTWREFMRDLKTLVEQDKIPISRIDDAVRRILTAKFKLGLFEQPMANRADLALIGSAEHRALARQAVRESLVVLKNDGILPLPRSGSRIVLVGAAADDVGAQCGGWTLSWQGQNGPVPGGTSILAGLKQLAPDSVFFAENADAVRDADIAIVVAAEKPYAEMEGDDPVLAFPKQAAADIAALRARGIPVVTILLSGRPLVAKNEVNASSAFVAAWLPGTEGAGVADILFGLQPPSGRLPFTWFDSVDVIPVNSSQFEAGVLFPYGYGM